MQQRIQDVQSARNQVGNDPTGKELDNVINAMKNQRYPGASEGDIERMANAIIDPLRSIELELSQKLQILTAKESIRSSSDDAIPANYQKQVEDYYKKLGSQKPPQ